MNRLLWLVVLVGNAICGSAQTTYLDLDKTIKRAQERSPSYSQAVNRAENFYWNYRQYRASLLPQLNLSGTLPQYSSAIDRVTQPDGTFDFRESEQLFLNSQLSIDQNVAFTGGRFSVISGLQRTDVIRPDERTSYFSSPISVNYVQPMILYNEIKWQRKTQPLAYEESQRRFSEEMEEIAREATSLYFDALRASINKRIAAFNVTNNDTIYKISEGRYNLGKIAENELLQMELNLLNAENTLTQAELQYEVASQNLKRYLGLPMDVELDLELPAEVPVVIVDLEKALAEAQNNRAAVKEFRRRRLEAEQEVARARGNTNYNLNLRANFGLNRQADEFRSAYRDPLLEQQNIMISMNIPLIDWGQARSQIRRAEANRELEEVRIEQDEINFEQEIFLQVMQFNAQYQQLTIAAKADTVAQKRYGVAKQRYLTGKISITDLNIAQAEKDQAQQSYVRALRTFWEAFYTVRRLTLYDFEAERPIEYRPDFEG